MTERCVFTLITGKIIDASHLYLLILRLCVITGRLIISLALTLMDVLNSTPVSNLMAGKSKSTILISSNLKSVNEVCNAQSVTVLIIIVRKTNVYLLLKCFIISLRVGLTLSILISTLISMVLK